MTREEIEELKGLAASMGLYDDKNPCKRAVILGKAIQELEQETVSKESYDHEYFLRKELEIKIAKLEQEPILNKIKAEIEQTSETVDGFLMHEGTKKTVLSIIDKYKALEQKPKTGHWISHREHCEMNNLRPSGLGSYFWCSECDCGIDSKYFHRVYYNYCPNCGRKME